MVMDIEYMTMIMKDDKFMILGYLILDSCPELSVKCVFHQVLGSFLCCFHHGPNYT
jgi:hypothetical protein